MYVVSPFSIHPDTGKPYEITQNVEITEAPEWLINWLKIGKKKNAARKKQAEDEGQLIKQGGRDTFLFDQACKLRDAGLPRSSVRAALSIINRERCRPPMPESVVGQKVESAFMREPRASVSANSPQVEAVVIEPSLIAIPDMPEKVLTGRLGEIYDKHMREKFPLAWVWVSLLIGASVLVPSPTTTASISMAGS